MRFFIWSSNTSITVLIVYSLHYEYRPVQNTAIFKTVKIDKISYEKGDIFRIFAQKLNCGYMLESS